MPTVANNIEDSVRRLRVRLYLAAKQSPNRRFHALYDRIHRRDVLERAWRKVRENRGSAGVDRRTISEIEEAGVERFLAELEVELCEQRYRPSPVRRVQIPKPGRSESRPLGIPTVKDRVVQQAAKLVLEPIFEADFHDCSFGFRPKRTAHDALNQVKRSVIAGGRRWVIDADIRGFFDALDQQTLMGLISRRVSDRRVLKLVSGWLRAGVLEGSNLLHPETGTPQGGNISPLLANIYLNALDQAWEEKYSHIGVLVRYADDLVIVCRSEALAKKALEGLREQLKALSLELSEQKTRLLCIADDGEAFDFLGFHHQMVESARRPGKRYFARWPSKRAMQRAKQRIRELSHQGLLVLPMEEIVLNLNQFLIGWGNYFRWGNSTRQFQQIDRVAADRIARLLGRKYKARRRYIGGLKRLALDKSLRPRSLVGTVRNRGF